ncbi:MAG TPA: hypothetical protein PKC18_21260, partial [Lacipirellulaceae bacterium]|nr:hypothetical protein [Lacipirellulaceae bacterium]
MGDGMWFRRARRRSSSGKPAGGGSKRKGGTMGSPWRRIMRIEPLEDRRLLATFMVTSPGDLVDGNVVFGSLRWALNQANADDDADVIVFADNITNIALNGGPLTISERVRILGPGPRKLTISQTQNNQRIFEVNNGDDDEAIPVEISGVTLTGGSQTGMGDERRGGAIRSLESLTMIEVNVRNNSASQGGGGIWVVRGGLTMDRSIVQNN